MTPARLIEHLQSRGVELSTRGDKLNVSDPAGVVTPGLRDELLSRKSGILEVLQWPQLIPQGWMPAAWHGRLLYLSKVCMDDARAGELSRWAEAVADAYELNTEVAR